MRTTILILSFILCLPYSKGFTQKAFTKESFQDCRVILNGVNFSVDPRIELFHTVEVISGIPLVNFIDLDYKQKILSKFATHKNHPLFAYLKHNNLYGKLFDSIDAPIWAMLHLTNDLEWRKDIDVPEAKSSGIDSLRILMKDFAKESNYVAFFNSNTNFYRISLATLTYNLPNFNEKQRLMNYCGYSKGGDIEFNVILNFLAGVTLDHVCIEKTVQNCMQ
jgi:hypothetical protein